MSERNMFDRFLANSMEIIFFMWVVASLVECSFTASTDKGVSVGVQTKQEEKKESPKKEITIDDGPKADWK